jgi:hypothetical protein
MEQVRYNNISQGEMLFLKTVGLTAVMAALTGVSIYVNYGPEELKNWLWIRSSILLSIISSLWVYSLAFFKVIGRKENDYISFIIPFIVLIEPLSILLIYPGTKGTGLQSDPNLFGVIFCVVIIHGAVCFYLQKLVNKYILYKP